MNAGPYSDERVQAFLEEQFVAVKSQCFWDKQTDLMQKFNVKWTPTLVVLDKRGIEYRRIIGFVPADDLLAHLLMGKAMAMFYTEHLTNAIQGFGSVIEKYPHAGPAPEAVFFLGVAEYKKGHDPKALRKAFDTLKEKYPTSEWARRAEPYGTIPA
ncbi:MAG: tetratricopeptide repeat protein [Nitrospirae bacterium]|nr:MAG: tetratricopeptide repeat protein [Nitrospirota bacterium]